MNKKITKLMAALALLLFMTPAMKVIAMDDGYTIGTTPLSSVSNGDLVVWGTSNSNLAKSCSSNWIYLSSTQSEWIVFTVETTTNGFYLKTPEGSYVYSSAAKKVEFSSTNKTVLTINSNNLVNGGSSIGNYTYNSTGIRPYASNNYTNAYLYAVTPSGSIPTTYTVAYDAGDGTGTMSDPNSPYEAGAIVTLLTNSFTAPTGYEWSSWDVKDASNNAVTVSNNQFTMPASNVTVTAQYTQSGGSGTATATLTQSNLELTGSYTTDTEKTIDGITYVYTDLMKSNSNIQAKASTGTIKNTTAYPGDITSVAITHSGTARATTINGSADGTNWTQVATGSGSITADFSGRGYKYFQITRGSNAAYWEKIDITYSTTSSSLTDSDLAITNASTTLSFDLYNNSVAQTITYTTSSTGSITITPASPTEYFSYVHDATAKTITVTPTAVTPSAQTVTINQAADDDYYAGSASFTVSIANSDPNVPGTVNNPYTVAQARAAIDANAGTQGVYATGIVSTIPTAYSTQYSNITFNMVDEAGDEVFLQAYRCGGNLASEVAVGDVAVVYGNLTKYGSTYEFGSGCQVVSLTHPSILAPAFSIAAGGYAEAQSVELSCETPNAVIYYTLDGSDPTNTSTQYNGAISVEESTTVKAVAYVGANHGPVAEAAYYILSENNVFTVTEALGFDEYPANSVFVHGIVSTAAESLYNGTLSYYISIDGEDNSELYVYRGKDLNNVAFENVDDIQVGDIVTIFGNVIEYGNDQVIEFASGNYLVEFERPTTPAVPSVTVTPNTINAAAEGANGTLAITYENIPDLISFDYYFCDAEGEELLDTDPNYPDWIDAAIEEENDVYSVEYTVNSNEGEARTAYIKVYTTDVPENEEVYAIVTITQAAYVAPPTAGDYVRITSLDQLTNGSKVVIAARYNSTANAYAAMPNVLAANTNHGKPAGVQFTSTTSGDYEVLPSAIVNEVNNYYWTVNIINNGEDYTFTNANGDIIACLQGESDFYLSTYYDYEWRIERSTASSQNNQAMVPGYTGFVITNRDVNNRAFAFNGEKFGDYHTNYTNTTGYNFFLDFFVQDEPQTYTKDITGWSAPGNNLNFYLIASPIGDVNPTAVTIEGDATATMVSGSFDLYYFDQAQANEWINYKPNTSGEGNASTNPGFNLERGTGYLYANQNTVTLEFTGTGSNSGEFPVELVYVSGAGIDLPGWNLLGNPFTENAYLVSNNSYRSFYTLDVNGNYISVTGNAVNAMEGIFVKAEATGETVTFTTAPLPSSKNFKLALNLSNGHNLIDRAIVRFDGGDQLPKLQFREGSTKVYIPVEGQDYAVVSCEEMGELPVSFKAEENGSYNLSLSSEEVSFAYLHLIDNMTGADVDLLQTPSYSFEARTTDYANRFKLVFATGDNSNDDNFAFFSNGSFVINNDGEATLQVIDVTGRIVKSESINGCANVNVNAAPGVYMLRLVNGDNVKVQKVVVK